jgi:hypothetical protein
MFKDISIEWMDFYILMPFLLLTAITLKYKIIFIAFAIIIAKNVFKLTKKELTIEQVLVSSSLYSLIINDNMIIIGLVALTAGYYLFKGIKNKAFLPNKSNRIIYIVTGIFLIYMIINIFYNKVPIQNVILYFMFALVFLAMLYIFKFKLMENIEYFDSIFNTIILVQAVYTVLFIPLNLALVKANLIGDWSVGTLGVSQGPILFNLCIFGFIKFFSKFRYSGEKNLIFWMILCFLGAASTVTVSMTLLFIGVFFVYIVFFVSKPKLKIGFIILTVALGGTFWAISDSWVKDQIREVAFNPQFRNARIKKLATYEQTFSIIPRNDMSFALLGEGLGNYSSRGALTASGYYTSWYNKDRFPVDTSNYARKYVKPRLYTRFGLSVLDLPTAQYISFMGELGYIGFGLISLLFLIWLIRSKGDNRLLLLYMFAIIALDNYLEYPKIALGFWIIYIIIDNYNKTYKTQ